MTKIRAGQISSGGAADGHILTADGAGNAEWEEAPAGGGGTISVQEADGTPSVSGVDTLIVSNGKLTDNADGSVTLDLSGDAASPDASTVTYTPATAGDWDGDTDPGNADDALDQLAERVADLEDIPGGTDANAIHVNQAGEIAAVTEKGSPASTDLILIEDSANSNAKARVQIGNLPGGGGGATIHTSAYGSPPASPASGDLWLPSDGVSLYRYSGSAWVPWGPLFAFTAPPTTGWSWVNQGTATVDTAHGSVHIEAPADGETFQNRLYMRATPATPFTIIACFLVRGLDAGVAGGLCWRQSADGKCITQNVGAAGLIGSQKLNSATAWNSMYFNHDWEPVMPLWVRVGDDGTNRTYAWSLDGQHWDQLHSVGRTDFLTADQIGIYALSNHASANCGVTLLSWKES